MNYRLQDFIRYIIPGLYVVALICGWLYVFGNYQFDIERISRVSGIIIVLIPFVGFVIGYFVESLMAIIEHLFYLLGGRRPSKTVLMGSLKMYSVEGKDRILEHHKVKANKISNIKAGEILQSAKQLINRGAVEAFRDNAILSRNIFGGHLMVTIVLLFLGNYRTPIFLYVSIVSLLLFFLYWCHHNHVYVKYVFAEYVKYIAESPSTKNN